MILKALYDYYNRCEGLTPKGIAAHQLDGSHGNAPHRAGDGAAPANRTGL